MAVKHIKIHKVGETKPLKLPFGKQQSFCHSVGIALCGNFLGRACVGDNVAYLSHRNNAFARLFNSVEHGFFGRNKGKIVSVRGALKIGIFPDKGAGDDPAHGVFPHKNFSGNSAVFIKLFGRNKALVGGDLENAVGRGIDNKLARFKMLAAEVLYNLRSRIGFVAQRPPAGSFFEFGYDLGRKALRKGGKRGFCDNTRNFEMTRGRVLSHGFFTKLHISGGGALHSRPAAYSVNVEKPHFSHFRHPEHIGFACRNNGGGTLVPEFLGVGSLPRTEAVKHDQKYSFQNFHPLSSRKIKSCRRRKRLNFRRRNLLKHQMHE